MTSVWHRLILGYIIVLPFVVSVVAGKLDALQPYTVALTMSSQVQGHVQLFYDGGAGFSEARSTTLVLDETAARHEYRLGLPPSARHRSGTRSSRSAIQLRSGDRHRHSTSVVQPTTIGSAGADTCALDDGSWSPIRPGTRDQTLRASSARGD